MKESASARIHRTIFANALMSGFCPCASRDIVDALTPIGDFNERFGATFSDEDYDTIGGLVTEAVGHLPEVGDELALDRFMFRVARADARRVQAFHVTVLPPDAQDDA